MHPLSLDDAMKQHIKDIAVFIVTHKDFTLPSGEIYIPIQVGESSILPYLSEHQLDNIANKNKNFCELTALYFIWKNVTYPIVGLVHYRRYFIEKNNILKKNLRKIQYSLKLKPKVFNARYDVINDKKIISFFNSGIDIIIPEAFDLWENTLYSHYAEKHYIKDWLIIRNILEQKYPEYLSTFDKVSNGKVLYPCNMFIAKKKIIDQYCEWLFNILFESEKLIDYHDYDDYNKRVFGFLAERLFTVWIIHHYNRFKFSHLPIAMTNG